jgi:hypothetical protein
MEYYVRTFTPAFNEYQVYRLGSHTTDYVCHHMAMAIMLRKLKDRIGVELMFGNKKKFIS